MGNGRSPTAASTPTHVAKVVLLWVTMVSLCHIVYAGDTSPVVVPNYSDKYSKSIKQLEAGNTNIDYKAFRENFLESEQFKIAGKQQSDLGELRKNMRQLMKASNYSGIIDVANKMLSIDYTDMEAHKILRQTYKALGDTANERKHHDIEFGLLNSIVKKGDGKTCETAWPVIQITEEYFILAMIGAKVLKQSLDNTGGLCDKMEVQTRDGNKTYYFEVSKVFEGYNKEGNQVTRWKCSC
jgi:Domain of unknown function (DUF4919)